MPRPRFISPPPLEELCLLALLRCLETDIVLCEVANVLQNSSLLLHRRDLSTQRIAGELKQYMSYLPGMLSEMVRQELTNKALQKYGRAFHRIPNSKWDLSPHTRTIRLLEIVMDDGIQNFDMSDIVPTYKPPIKAKPGELEVWELVLGRCPNLRKFSIPSSLSCSLKVDLNPFLIRLAHDCRKLTEVVLKDAIKDGLVLASFAKQCPNIRILDIAGSEVECTDMFYLIFSELDSTRRLRSHDINRLQHQVLLPRQLRQSPKVYNSLCYSMRELNLSNTNVRANGAYLVIKFMPNLVSLGEFVFAASGLKKCYLENKFKSPLKQLYYRGPNCEKMKVVGSTCPDLESLYFGSNTAKRLNFKHLSKLSNLDQISLELPYPIDVGHELRYIRQLRTLELSVPDVDIGIIIESCPMLVKLVVSVAPLRTITSPFKANDPQPILAHLEELQLECQVSLEVAALLLTKSPQLKAVKLVRVKKLTDKILEDWLNINPLEHLETWLLHYSQLTLRSVTLLLTVCQKLHTLGRLAGWDVRSWESRRLQRVWQNHHIDLVHFSQKQCDVAQIIEAIASSDEETEWL